MLVMKKTLVVIKFVKYLLKIIFVHIHIYLQQNAANNN